MCTVRASRASGKSTGSQITRPSHSRPGMSRKCDESTLLHHQARTGTDLDRAGVLLACPAAMQMPKMRMHSLWSLCTRCLRLFNSHTCSISQCNHKFWLNYRIKMFVLNLKMCVRVQPALSCCSQLLATSNGQANTSPTGLPSLQPLPVNQGRPSTSPSPSPSLTTIAVPNLKTGTHSRLHVQLSARRI